MSTSAKSKFHGAASLEAYDENIDTSDLPTKSDRDLRGARNLDVQEITPDGQQNTPIWVVLVLLVAVVALSSAGSTFALVDDVAPVRLASWRLQMTSLIILLPCIWQFHHLDHDSKRRTFRSAHKMLFSGICLALHFSCWVWGLQNTSLFHAYLFSVCTPIGITVGCLLLRKPVSAAELAGTCLGVLGGFVLTFGHSQVEGGNFRQANLKGDLVVFCAAILVIGYLQVGAELRQWMPLLVMAMPVTGVAALCMTVATLVVEGSHVVPLDNASAFGWVGGVHILPMAWLAVVPGTIGHQGMNLSLKYFSPLTIALLLTTEPLIGSFIGYMLHLTKAPGLYIYVGGFLIITATVIVTMSSHQRQTNDAGSLKRQKSYLSLPVSEWRGEKAPTSGVAHMTELSAAIP